MRAVLLFASHRETPEPENSALDLKEPSPLPLCPNVVPRKVYEELVRR